MSGPRIGSPLAALARIRASWRRAAPFLGVSRARLGVLAAVSVAAGMVEAGVLALVAAIANSLSTGDDRVAVDLGPFTLDSPMSAVFAVAFGLAAARGLLHALAAYLPSRMSADAMAATRMRLFDAFTATSWAVQSAERDGHFQSLMSGHVGQASVAVVTLGRALTALAMFSTLVAAAVVLSPLAAVALAALSSVLFVAMRPLSRLTRRESEVLSREGIEYTQGLQEVVRLAEEVQVFGASPAHRRDFSELVEQVRVPLWRSRFLTRLVPVLYQSVALVILLVALAVVAGLETSRLPSLTAVVLLLVRSLAYGNAFQESLTSLAEIAPFMDRLRDALDHYEAHRRRDGGRPMPPVRRVAMNDVSFGYTPGEDVLRHVDLDVAAGERIGIVGPSGAGKSSLVQLLLRLRDPGAGSYRINDVDVRDIRLDEWQAAVAHVPQSPILRWGTVADNIRFHRDGIDDDRVREAARLAHVHDEIVSWPHGYDTVVGDRAAAVSGGQRQRLCLARALVTRPRILVLDEPTSALDVRSEALIQESLAALGDDVVLFMVAHRLSTLAVCDRVVVVVDGRIEAVDTPERLVEVNDFFGEAAAITHGDRGRPAGLGRRADG